MTEKILRYPSIMLYKTAFVSILIFIVLFSFFLSPLIILPSLSALMIDVVWFIVFPILISVVGFILGWKAKKNAVKYDSAEFVFEPEQYTIREMKELEKNHNHRYSRAVSTPSFWDYFIPIILVLSVVFFRMVLPDVELVLGSMTPQVYTVLVAALLASSTHGSWKATSNKASEDLNLRLIRETLSLARVQERIAGVENLRIVMDKAEEGNVEIYEDPRVLFRIKGIEEHSFVETWSDEVGSAQRLYAKLLPLEQYEGIAFWWHSHDRYFQSSNGSEDSSRYVRSPLANVEGEIGVKDIDLITETAVALLAIQWLETRGSNSSLSKILKEMNIETSG